MVELIDRPVPGSNYPSSGNTASQNFQVTNAAPEPSILTPPPTADFKVAMTHPDVDNAQHAVTASRAIAILESKKPYSNLDNDSKVKRKRRAPDADDTAETATKRTRPTVTEHPYAPTAPMPAAVGHGFTPINIPSTTPATHPTGTEHPDALTAPGPDAADHDSFPPDLQITMQRAHPSLVVEPSYEPTPPPGLAGYVTVEIKVPVMKEQLEHLETVPFKSVS